MRKMKTLPVQQTVPSRYEQDALLHASPILNNCKTVGHQCEGLRAAEVPGLYLQSWRVAASQKGAQIFPSLESALAQLEAESGPKRPETVFVIGGGQVSKSAQK